MPMPASYGIAPKTALTCSAKNFLSRSSNPLHAGIQLVAHLRAEVSPLPELPWAGTSSSYPWILPKNPKNVWPNIAHELGGHFEYGPAYATEIMMSALEHLPEAERKKWRTAPEVLHGLRVCGDRDLRGAARAAICAAGDRDDAHPIRPTIRTRTCRSNSAS